MLATGKTGAVRRFASWFGLLMIASGAGCAGIGKIQDQPMDAGEEVALDAPFKSAKAACRQALLRTGFEIVDERTVGSGSWVIIGDLSSATESWGQYARVVLTPVDRSVTNARFHSVRKMDMNRSEDLAGVRRRFLLNLQTAIVEQEVP